MVLEGFKLLEETEEFVELLEEFITFLFWSLPLDSDLEWDCVMLLPSPLMLLHRSAGLWEALPV